MKKTHNKWFRFNDFADLQDWNKSIAEEMMAFPKKRGRPKGRKNRPQYITKTEALLKQIKRKYK